VKAVPSEELRYREGSDGDLRAAYELGERALADTARRMGVAASGSELTDGEIDGRWRRERSLVEFIAAHENGSFWLCEGPDGLLGYARVVRFDGMEELAQIMVQPARHGLGIGSGLLERCWPSPPTPELGRLVIAAGSGVDLSLYTGFGTMPITGHWHLQQRAEPYLERRLQEPDAVEAEAAVHVLERARAVEEWKRLEPAAIAHERPALHEFFGRERTCLASLAADPEHARALCWVGSDGEIGPAVGEAPEDLVPVVLAALDRVAKGQEPEELHLFCTTDSWWLLRRLRGLGFRVSWPSWVLCSIPLPGLDRYVPTRPPLLL
jgi:GNAT superfamily N-acetyltransferase